MCCIFFVFFFCKQKTAYEMRISDWSSDVCSSDLGDVSAKSGRGMRLDVAIGGGERICRLPPDRAPDGAADRTIGRSERDASRLAGAGDRVHRSTEPATAR